MRARSNTGRMIERITVPQYSNRDLLFHLYLLVRLKYLSTNGNTDLPPKIAYLDNLKTMKIVQSGNINVHFILQFFFSNT